MSLELIKKKDGVLIKGINDFNLKQTFECGQCFRWDEEKDGSFTGVALNKVINIKKVEDYYFIKNINEEEFNNQLSNYFDFSRDYSLIKKKLSLNSIMKDACIYGYGIRLLNQDIWEIIISFIISANNNIPRIKKIIKNICEKFGKPIEFCGKTYYSFPDINDIKRIQTSDLDFCRCGYRAEYIVDAIAKISSGEIDILKLREKETGEIRNELMKIKGIGPKVADCILLFSFGRYEVFPIDVWIKRTMTSLFLKEDSNGKDILKFANNEFGQLAGFAQQYLFFRYREESKKG